jgi:hypothetical protein
VLWHQPCQTDLQFISLNKSEALFSPSIRTRDLALGLSLFHWEYHERERPIPAGWMQGMGLAV